jgi:hypothetical protein
LPKVCVVLPVHDAEAHLPVALASLLLQEHRELEVVAIDDGSSDVSGRILESVADRDPRVRVIRRENRGLIATLNEGLDRADSDLVARMDADDISYPDRLAAQVEAFAEDGRLGLHGCNFDMIHAPGRVTPASPPAATADADLRVLSRFFTILRHPAVMFRRSSIPGGVLAYDPAYPHAEDFDVFRRIARVAAVGQGTRPRLAYRLHPGSVSARHERTMQRTHLRILEEEMRRHYPALAGTGVERLAETVDPATVAAAAEFVRRLWALIEDPPGADGPALRIASRTVFYLLYSIVLNAGDHALAHRFVTEAGRWDMIRRRERLFMSASNLWSGLATAGYALHYRQLGVAQALGSVPLRRAVPAHDRITALAGEIEAAAGVGAPA